MSKDTTQPPRKPLQDLVREYHPTLSTAEVAEMTAGLTQDLTEALPKRPPRFIFVYTAFQPIDLNQPSWRQISAARLKLGGLVVLGWIILLALVLAAFTFLG
jgi:hypothetical protein